MESLNNYKGVKRVRAYFREDIPTENGFITFKFKDNKEFKVLSELRVVEIQLEDISELPDMIDFNQFKKILHEDNIIYQDSTQTI